MLVFDNFMLLKAERLASLLKEPCFPKAFLKECT